MSLQRDPADETAPAIEASQRVGIYKTREAARQARDMMLGDGIPSAQVSLLSTEDPSGLQLATKRGTQAPLMAWLGMLGGTLFGGVIGAVLGRGAVSFAGMPIEIGARTISGLLFAFAFGLVGAAIGAVFGAQRAAYRTNFQQADAPDAGTALGVVTTSEEQDERARYAFKSTGAVDVHEEPARVLPRAV